MRRLIPSILGRTAQTPQIEERRNPMRVKTAEVKSAKAELFANPPDYASQVAERVEGFAELQAIRRARPI